MTWRCSGRIRQRATVDWQARHVRVRIAGRVFIAVAPTTAAPAPPWNPLVVDAASLTTINADAHR
jgi:hypothetical protein